MITTVKKKTKLHHNNVETVSYNMADIAKIIDADFLCRGEDAYIENLITDSRKLLFPETSLFFAMPGPGRRGDMFIKGLYEKDVKNFVVGESFSDSFCSSFTDANMLKVKNVSAALQALAAFHRHTFHFPVIGITGSNGKTIVKEWLYQLLGDVYNVVRSPKSYNSQIGVPLSVWRMNESHNLGIFESGISQPGEMQNLQKIIDPQIGIFTFIGTAHDAGFETTAQKINEKLQLFTGADVLIYNSDDVALAGAVKTFTEKQNTKLRSFTISKKENGDLSVKQIKKSGGLTKITCVFENEEFNFAIPFTDEASVNNALICCGVMLYLKVTPVKIAEKMPHLRPLEMRLELKQGLNNCSVINDSYSADLDSLGISLDFLEQQNRHEKRTVILSDILESGKDADTLYRKMASVLSGRSIFRFIGIGSEISSHAHAFSALQNTFFYSSTDAFLQEMGNLNIENETILLKGARVFRFEKISSMLEQKLHETFLEINLNALRNNVKVYRQLIQPGVKIMAMVKAFSYGSGSFEIANLLQHSGIDYLAVAYSDEGADLRRNGIQLPVMVMNTEPSGFENIYKHRLEPVLYSFKILQAFKEFLQHKNAKHYPIHIKIDTGMHRLGFDDSEADELAKSLGDLNYLKVVSVFSHLAGSDATGHDDFTIQQASVFAKVADTLKKALGYNFLRHIANSSAIYRHPALQMDMVRAGIGLYGIDASKEIQHKLQPVTVLKTTVSQIKNVRKGESIGYSRKGIALQDSKIATVQIGYADGYPRSLSNGKGKMLINGNPVPVIGNICMDMTMLDVTGTDAEEGDTVIVFGEEPTVTDVAGWADTIPYEILTNISQRVKRVYYEE